MKELLGRARSACGSFIVDHRGTILGFDQELETLTGWPAVEIVGRHKNLETSLGSGENGLGAAPLYEGNIPVVRDAVNLSLTVNCRDGRQLEVESVAERLTEGSEQMRVTVLRVLSLTGPGVTRRQGARIDALTLLPGAGAFFEMLEHEFERAVSAARPVGLLLVDVDHLRTINDRLGLHVGDEVLQKLAGVLRVCIPEENRIHRIGDDDFAILLPGSGRGDARQLGARIRSTVERYFSTNSEGPENDAEVTVSLGAASFPADADSSRDLLERAREALDEARSMGRNRVWCYLRRPRVPVHVPVFFDGTESLLVGYTRDLSPSGIFVQTSVPIEIGMRCALSFPLPGHDERVHVIGRVVRTVAPETSVEHHDVRIPGMGVEFERFGGNRDRRAIDAFLHRHESLSTRPETGILSSAP